MQVNTLQLLHAQYYAALPHLQLSTRVSLIVARKIKRRIFGFLEPSNTIALTKGRHIAHSQWKWMSISRNIYCSRGVLYVVNLKKNPRFFSHSSLVEPKTGCRSWSFHFNINIPKLYSSWSCIINTCRRAVGCTWVTKRRKPSRSV